jgi:acetylglutamate kinase
MKDLINKAATLIEALPYIQRFKDALVVVKFGGSAMEDPELTANTMRDIVLMEAIGMKPVVVHGGGKAITARLAELNIETKFVHGLRHTCEQTVKVVDDVLHSNVNKSLLDGVREAGGNAVMVSGKDILRAEKMHSINPENGEPVDVGFVGNIVSVDTSPILAALAQNLIPVITPLGTDAKGQVYNINADIAACKIAKALKSRKLVFLSDVPGILRDHTDESTLIPTIKVSEVEKLIADKVISGGMIPKIRSSIHALEAGTNKVHMIDGRVKHSLLLEIFTDEGIGTQIIKG